MPGNSQLVIEECASSENNEQMADSKEKKKIRISVFFDGTGNNRANTEARLLSEKSGLDLKAKDLSDEDIKRISAYIKNGMSDGEATDSSYSNHYTNVSKLEKFLLDEAEGFDVHKKVYIEGIGTQDLDADSTFGQATGRGDTGVAGKVSKAIVDKIVTIVKANISPQKDILELIHLDSFGFSRGATAARYFVYAALEDSKLMITKQLPDYSIGQVKSGFVGLFDTVVSVKGYQNLHMDAVAKSEKVVHLVAEDEYRTNFPYTNIKSKGSLEIKLPGCHSDVGGSYNDNSTEKNMKVFKGSRKEVIKDINWLINEGWCAADSAFNKKVKDEIAILGNFSSKMWETQDKTLKIAIEAGIKNDTIVITRKDLRNTYARIPLHIMKTHTVNSVLKFGAKIDIDEPMPAREPEHATLNQLYAMIGSDGQNAPAVKGTEICKKVRAKYFHFSAYIDRDGYSTAAWLVGVNAPRLVGGVRIREELNG